MATLQLIGLVHDTFMSWQNSKLLTFFKATKKSFIISFHIDFVISMVRIGYKLIWVVWWVDIASGSLTVDRKCLHWRDNVFVLALVITVSSIVAHSLILTIKLLKGLSLYLMVRFFVASSRVAWNATAQIIGIILTNVIWFNFTLRCRENMSWIQTSLCHDPLVLWTAVINPLDFDFVISVVETVLIAADFS